MLPKIARYALLCCCLFNGFTLFAQNAIYGLASPIQLTGDTTFVFLRDYFLDPSSIIGIGTDADVKGKLSKSKDTLLLFKGNKPLAPVSVLKIQTKESTYSLIIQRPKNTPCTFTFDPKGKIYDKVAIVGDLTGWNPNQIYMQHDGDKWKTTINLNPGRYQYQIVADGKWFLDPGKLDSIENGIGGYNSLRKHDLTDQLTAPRIIPAWLDSAAYNGNNWHSINVTANFKPHEGEIIALWENKRIRVDTAYRHDPVALTENPYYEVIIPVDANIEPRSHIRIFAYANGKLANDLLIPLEYGKVITNPDQLTRTDFQRTIMYFMMVDRFVNGDKSNDQPVKDKRVDPRANYMGGDLAGVQKVMDNGYFKSLGVNALWISPVFQNPMGAYQEFPEPHRWFSGYHGYWPISLSKVDVRFGTNDLFKSMITDAHGKDMAVYLDYVANHIHAEHPLWTAHPEWFSALDLPDGRKNLRLWDEYRLTTWFEPYMPSFDHAQPVVAEACADSAMYWLKTFDIDGFRHDATKHIETDFWRLLTYKIKTEVSIPENKPVYQIGETFGSRELIGSYVGSGMLDAQFDFNTYFDARSVFASQDVPFSRLSTSLYEAFGFYGWHHIMGNITGNHDMARFISYASGDLKWDENDKEAGWNRKIMVSDPVGYERLKMLHAFNLTIPGIPIIYYGDEFGMPGANDPDNRRMMYFDLSPAEQNVQKTVQQLTHLRNTHMALLYGDFRECPPVEQNPLIFAYLRTYFKDAVLVVFNKQSGAAETTITLPAVQAALTPVTNFGNSVTKQQGNQLKVTFTKGNSFEIITFVPVNID